MPGARPRRRRPRAVVTEARDRDHLARRRASASSRSPRDHAANADSRRRQVRGRTTSRAWQHGLLVHVAEGRRARASRSTCRSTVDRRLALLAAGRRRRGGRALHPDRGFRPRPRPTWSATRTPPSSSSSSHGAKLEYVSLQNLSRETWHFAAYTRASSATPSSTGSPAASARRAARCGSRTTSPARAPPRASPAPTSPTATQHLDYDTFQEHIAPNTESDFAFKGALRDEASAVWRGMIRVEPDAQKTNAYQENRNLLLSERGARRLDPRPRDPRQRRALHARRDARPDRPRAALLPDGARPLAAPRPSA